MVDFKQDVHMIVSEKMEPHWKIRCSVLQQIVKSGPLSTVLIKTDSLDTKLERFNVTRIEMTPAQVRNYAQELLKLANEAEALDQQRLGGKT